MSCTVITRSRSKLKIASKRRNMFYENKKQETTVIGMDVLTQAEEMLRERMSEISRHKQLLQRLDDIKAKVRQRKEQIDLQWQSLTEKEAKEIELLENEKETVDNLLKNETIQSSKESIAKAVFYESAQINKTNNNKFPPSKLGNYTIMAKRLQTEIKQLDQNVNEVKIRLQQELQNKNNLENKIRGIRNNMSSQRKHDSLTAATTPVQ